MWIIFIAIAIILTCANLYLYVTARNFTVVMALALSFTALTVCAALRLIANWVNGEDWSALLDVVPTMTNVLWVFTLLLIFINLAPLLFRRQKVSNMKSLKKIDKRSTV